MAELDEYTVTYPAPAAPTSPVVGIRVFKDGVEVGLNPAGSTLKVNVNNKIKVEMTTLGTVTGFTAPTLKDAATNVVGSITGGQIAGTTTYVWEFSSINADATLTFPTAN